MFAATPALHFYVTAGRGFETPTLNELAYRPNGQTGLNLALGAATSDSYEAGVKTRNDWGDVNVALFETRTSNEIATLSNVGGRSTYQNVGSTRRRGARGGVERATCARTCARRSPTPGSTRATATPSRPAR